jgi:DNA polymerase III epsilon subunit-like protein
MEKIKILFNDTETEGTGLEDRIIQTAQSIFSAKLTKKGLTLKKEDYIEEMIMPPRGLDGISPGAAAVHGLWKDDLIGAPSWSDSESKKQFEKAIKEDCFYCAHNSPFDIGMLNKEGINYPRHLVIDTLRVARHIFKDNPDIESKGLQWMRRYFDFDCGDKHKEKFQNLVKSYNVERLQPHTALDDVIVLVYFFQFLFDEGLITSFKDIQRLSLTPIYEDKVTFGNIFEKGSKLSEAIPSTYQQFKKNKRGYEYFSWAMKEMDSLSLDVKLSISKYTVEAWEKGEIELNDHITPMVQMAATFIPEKHDFLKSKGVDVDSIKNVTLKGVNKKIKTMEENDPDKAIEYKKNIAFLNYYVDFVHTGKYLES